MYSFFRNLHIFWIILAVGACSNLSVSPGASDTSGRYEGSWNGVVGLKEIHQAYGHFEWTCSQYRSDLHLEVAGGYVQGFISTENTPISFRTNIDPSGRFLRRIVDPRIDSKIVISGRLDAATNRGEGKLIVGQTNVPNGCKADWVVNRESKSSNSPFFIEFTASM